MQLFNKKYLKIIILVISVLSISTIALAISSTFSHPESQLGANIAGNSNVSIQAIENKLKALEDDRTAVELAETYKKSKDEILKLKEKLGSWNEVTKALFQEKLDNNLPKDKVLELYKQGYGIQDIEKAEELARLCEKSPEELLKKKGKTLDFQTKTIDGKESKKKTSWDDVIKEFNIDTRTKEEKVGMPAEKLPQNQALADARMIELLKKKANITDKDISMCKEKGVEVSDLGLAKEISDKYKLPLDQVIDLKKEKKNWKEVIIELGGHKQ